MQGDEAAADGATLLPRTARAVGRCCLEKLDDVAATDEFADAGFTRSEIVLFVLAMASTFHRGSSDAPPEGGQSHQHADARADP